MKKELFTGSGVAIVTPMYANGDPDYDTLKDLIEFQLTNKTDAIIICGTTGEASALDDVEHLRTIKVAVDTVNKRVPVIAGTGSNDTRHCVALSTEAKNLGVDALLQVTPYYNKTNQDGLIKHFTTVADNVGIPMILYNVPSRTGLNIAIDTYKTLAQHPMIVATKEANSSISHIAGVAHAVGDKLAIYSGNDDMIVPVMSLGGSGVISVVANLMPKETHDICQFYLDGKVKESADLQLKLLPLINAIFCDVNPIPVKEAVNMLGYAAGKCRLPLGELSVAHTQLVKDEMIKLGLI